MDKRRIDLRMSWQQVARRAGMTTTNLTRIRTGRSAISWAAIEGLERALLWSPGSIEAFVLHGTEPEELSGDAEPSPPMQSELDNDLDAEGELIFEGFRSLFRKHGKRMTPRALRRLLDDIDAELQQRGVTFQAAETPVTFDDESHEDGDR